MQKLRILAIEDNPGDFVLLEELLSNVKTFRGEITNVTSLSASISLLQKEKYDVIFLDLSLPDSSGMDSFSSIYSQYSEVPVIILSGLPESELAIEIVKAGAQDYLVKGEINTALVEKTISYSIARKQAEKDIIFKSGILSSVRESIIVTDFNGNIIYWNEGARIKLGYHPDEVIGKSLSIIYQNPISEGILKDRLQAIRGEGEFKGEFIAKNKDGTSVWLEVRTRVIHDQHGKPIGMIDVSRSIEERKKADLQLKRSEANLKAIFNNTCQAFVLLDRNYRILSFNKMANEISLRLLKHSLYEGASFLDLIAVFPVNRFMTHFNNAINGKKMRLENRLRGPDYEDSWLETYFTPVIDDKGECIGVAISSIDITQRKKDEAIIRQQNEELQKTNSELDSFVYSASHDLKAPLSAILGIINVAVIDPVEDSKDQYLAMIEKNVKRLMTIIKDLTNFSRNARTAVTKEKIDFKYLINEILNSYQYLENSSLISYNVSVNLNNDFFSDRLRLQILLSNLISNAIIFHNTKQKNPYINLIVRSIDPGIEIVVEDNGTGIDEKYIKRIFDMFYRASTSSQGSGIGLYIVKGIAEKLKGSVQVESKIMQGTKFILRFEHDISPAVHKDPIMQKTGVFQKS